MVRRSKRDRNIVSKVSSMSAGIGSLGNAPISGMFTPSIVPPAGAKAGSIFEVPDASKDLIKYLEMYSNSDLSTMGVIGSIIYKLAQTSIDTSTLGINCDAMFKSGAAAVYITMVEVKATIPPSNDDDVRSLVLSNNPSSSQWICDLVNGANKKKLTGANVEGLFAAYGGASIKGLGLANLINKVSDFLPDMISNQAFRGALTNNKWTVYHSSRVSTGTILLKISEDFINLKIYQNNSAIHNAIRNSAAAPYSIALSDLIPRRVVGYAALFLESCGTPLENWVQGNRERDSIPNAKVNGIKILFRKYLELNSNLADIESSATTANLLSKIPITYWT